MWIRHGSLDGSTSLETWIPLITDSLRSSTHDQQMFNGYCILSHPKLNSWFDVSRSMQESTPLCCSDLSICNLVGGIPTPLKNMSSSVGMMTFPRWWENHKIPCSKPNSLVFVQRRNHAISVAVRVLRQQGCQSPQKKDFMRQIIIARITCNTMDKTFNIFQYDIIIYHNIS